MSTFLGKHLLIELYDCDRARLNDETRLRADAVAAAHAMGASVVAVHAHRFQPHGVSLVVVLAESHLALHTWPELGTASGDIFVCSGVTDPHRAKAYLAASLGAGRVMELELERGQLDPSRAAHWQAAPPGAMTGARAPTPVPQ